MTTDLDPRVIQRLADMHAVYRMFDRAGRLLYVGITGHASRFDQHGVKRWFPAVASITLEWHDTEASARVGEHWAIRNERPRYNIAGKPKVSRRKITAASLPPAAETKPEPEDRDVLGDVLAIFGSDSQLHWDLVATRLAKQFPGRWAQVTKDAVSAQCRSLGVRSTNVRYPAGRMGKVRKGCYRIDVEAGAVDLYLGRETSTSA